VQTGESGIRTRFSIGGALRARQAALPAEHGAWVFLFSPLAIGMALGGFRLASLLLVAAALAAFLARQPVTMMVKAFSGRRPKSELNAAGFWLAIYGLLGLVSAGALAVLGYGFIVRLALPAVPVFVWHLWLVSRRAERRKAAVEMAGAGVLALAAPAAYWVGLGQYDPTGWLLWGLCWMQVAGTILYAYLRLEQRVMRRAPAPAERLVAPGSLVLARATIVYHLAALLIATGLSVTAWVPAWVPAAFLIQPLELAWGILHPAVGVKPKAIGIRQLIVSIIFTLAFIIAWG
jgi:hypothetical protein